VEFDHTESKRAEASRGSPEMNRLPLVPGAAASAHGAMGAIILKLREWTDPLIRLSEYKGRFAEAMICSWHSQSSAYFCGCLPLPEKPKTGSFSDAHESSEQEHGRREAPIKVNQGEMRQTAGRGTTDGPRRNDSSNL
jgi:hypothetical protein